MLSGVLTGGGQVTGAAVVEAPAKQVKGHPTQLALFIQTNVEANWPLRPSKPSRHR